MNFLLEETVLTLSKTLKGTIEKVGKQDESLNSILELLVQVTDTLSSLDIRIRNIEEQLGIKTRSTVEEID